MEDGGRDGHDTRTWSSISGTGVNAALPDLPVNALALDPVSPTTTLYAGTDGGVFRTTSGGSRWEIATTPLGLPNVPVKALKVCTGNRLPDGRDLRPRNVEVDPHAQPRPST